MVVAVYEISMEYVFREGLDFVMRMIFSNQIYLLFVFFFYSFISVVLVFQVAFLVIFYFFLVVMGVTIFQMFYKKKKLNEVSKLVDVLKTYNVGVDVEQIKSQFSWNFLTLYLVFFGVLLLLVVSFSLLNKSYIFCFEICIFCGVLLGICFVVFSDSYDLLILLFFFCNFFFVLFIFFYYFFQFFVVIRFLYLVIDVIIIILCGVGFKIYFGISFLVFLLIFFIFVVMVVQKFWKGVYRVLVFYLVCYFWFNFMLSFFLFFIWKGLIRGIFGYLFLLFLIFLILLLFCGGIIYGVYCFLNIQIFGKFFIILIFVLVLLLMIQIKLLIGKKLDSKI